MISIIPWLVTLAFLFAQFHPNTAQSHCNAIVYGKPEINDCFTLYNQLPGETLSPDIDKDAPRSFVEPKFLEPPFANVPNPYTSQMVQLPKLWRIGR